MKKNAQGFTLVELLVVIAIIGLLATLMFPVVGKGMEGAKKKRAGTEASSLVVAVTQYDTDHHFMPSTESKKVGKDQWITTDDKAWLAILQGDNAFKKNYLTVKMNDEEIFLDPWGHPYHVGMDRNRDDCVDASSGNKVAQKRVVAISCGPDGTFGNDDDITTCEWQ